MKVLLLDLDLQSRRKPFPNLALMKLSAYHKAHGDEVHLNFPLCQPDFTVASCVFTWNKRELAPYVITGGSGFRADIELTPKIEHLMPDYGLYSRHPWVDYSIGFTSRGCIRKCPWCIVPQKEGTIKDVARIYEFWNPQHRKIMLLDNNFLAAPSCQKTLEDILAEGLEVDFNQGLDARLLEEKHIPYFKRLKFKQLRFAFDDIAYEKSVRKAIHLLTENGINSRRLCFYMLVGFENDNTAVERAKILASLNIDIYPMIYKNSSGEEPMIQQTNETLYLNEMHGARANLRKFLRIARKLT